MRKVVCVANQPPHPTVEYEVWMLRETQKQIAAWDKSKSKRKQGVAYYAVLESCLVHARALFEFFYDEPDLEKFPNTLHPGLLLPSGVSWPYRKRMPRRMDKLRGMINALLQHISVRPENHHNWSLSEIREHIDALVLELNRLLPPDRQIDGTRHPGTR